MNNKKGYGLFVQDICYNTFSETFDILLIETRHDFYHEEKNFRPDGQVFLITQYNMQPIQTLVHFFSF